jgi:hypothetical protein
MSPTNPSAGSAASQPQQADIQQLIGLLGNLMPLLVRFQSQPFGQFPFGQSPMGGGLGLSQPALEHQAAVSFVGDIVALAAQKLSTYLEANAAQHANLESCVAIVTQAEQSLAARDYAQAFDLIWQAYRMIVFIRATDPQIPPLRAVDGAGFSASGRSTASH